MATLARTKLDLTAMTGIAGRLSRHPDMLKRIQIRNFRSCKDVTLDNLPPVTALIGRNGAGKTNVLKAIDWMARAGSGGSLDIASYPLPILDWQLIISAVIQLKRKSYSYALGLYHRAVDKNSDPFRLTLKESVSVQEQGANMREICTREGTEIKGPDIDHSIKIGSYIPCMPALESLLPASSVVVKQIQPLLHFLRNTRYYPLDEPSDAADQSTAISQVIQDEEYKQWLEKYKQTGDAGTSVLFRLIHMHEAARTQFEDFENLLGSNGLGLVDTVQVHRFERPFGASGVARSQKNVAYYVQFTPNKQNGVEHEFLSYSHLSCGTRRIIRILVSIIFDQSSLVLMEHPEDGIHTGLVKKLLGLLRSNLGTAQILMSSHSTTILSALDPNEVRLVTKEGSQTKVRSLTKGEISAASRFITEEGGSLADFIETVEG
jgi:predicted ATPase